MSRTEAASRSRSIACSILRSEEYRRARSVLGYSPVSGEADIMAVLEDTLNSGRLLYLPRVEPAQRILQICRVSSLDDLALGCFGVREPLPGAVRLDREELQTLDLAVIPGIVFDLRGHRLGYGKGYFDRLLKAPTFHAYTVGVCFSDDLVPEIPADPWDISVDRVITDNDQRGSE